MVLEAACSDGSLMLLPLLDQMLNGLHIQVKGYLVVSFFLKKKFLSEFDS